MNNQGGPRSPSPAERQLREGYSAFQAALDRLGWTDEVLVQRLGALVDAETTLVTTKNGEFTDEYKVPDNRARQAAIHTMLQLKRAYPSTKVEIAGTVRVEQLQAIALRMEAMPVEQLIQMVEAEDAELVALAEGGPRVEERRAELPGLPAGGDPEGRSADLPPLPRGADGGRGDLQRLDDPALDL